MSNEGNNFALLVIVFLGNAVVPWWVCVGNPGFLSFYLSSKLKRC